MAHEAPLVGSDDYLPPAYRLEAHERDISGLASSLPRCVFIEVTNRCNSACATCPRTFVTNEKPRDITWEEFVDLVDQFPNMERAVLHGIGEPLLNELLPRMISFLKLRGINVLFNSNAALLTSAWQDSLIRCGLDEFRVSIDSSDPEEYRIIRGRPLLHKVVENLRGLVATKRAQGSKTPRLSLWSMAMKSCLGSLPDLIRLAAEIGVDEVYLQRMTYHDKPSKNGRLAIPDQAIYGRAGDQESAVIDQCEELSKSLGVVFRASGATDPRSSVTTAGRRRHHPWTSCLRPWTTAYITAHGNALPCCIAPFATDDYESLILGNTVKQSFQSIWNDKPYRQWRTALLSSHPNEACGGCGVNWSL